MAQYPLPKIVNLFRAIRRYINSRIGRGIAFSPVSHLKLGNPLQISKIASLLDSHSFGV